jgi:hypothetical protein
VLSAVLQVSNYMRRASRKPAARKILLCDSQGESEIVNATVQVKGQRVAQYPIAPLLIVKPGVPILHRSLFLPHMAHGEGLFNIP